MKEQYRAEKMFPFSAPRKTNKLGAALRELSCYVFLSMHKGRCLAQHLHVQVDIPGVPSTGGLLGGSKGLGLLGVCCESAETTGV